MKNLLTLLIAVAFTNVVVAADLPSKPETKKACVTQKDAKTGKEKEVCKTIKVHKKHEGTTIEGTKPDVQPKKK